MTVQEKDAVWYIVILLAFNDNGNNRFFDKLSLIAAYSRFAKLICNLTKQNCTHSVEHATKQSFWTSFVFEKHDSHSWQALCILKCTAHWKAK